MEQKRLKILYTIPNFNTAGSGKSVYDLVKGLDKTLFEPEVCCFHDKGAFFEEVKALGVKIHLFPFTTTYKPYIGFLFRVIKIRNFFKRHQFDLIHSWHWSSDISEPLAAKLAGIPYVYTKKAMGWESRFWKLRSHLSTKIVVVNEAMVAMYFKGMIHKIYQFPLAIDTNVYRPELPNTAIQKQLNILPEDFVIISVANLVDVKGIEILLEAVKQLKVPEIKVIIVGDDSTDYALNLKLQYQHEGNIIFTGKKLDIKPYLALSDIFVIPTKDEGRREGIPNAPLEAMAMECIVLGSNITGIKDILKQFPDCLFEAENISELSSKLKYWMVSSKETKQKLGAAMRQCVIDEFSIKDFIKNHEVMYRNLKRL